MKNKRILVTWIGHTDLWAMAQSLKEPDLISYATEVANKVLPKAAAEGPIRSLVSREPFDEVHIASDLPVALNVKFARWFGCNPIIHPQSLIDPYSFRTVYEKSSQLLENVVRKDATLCLFLTPGTPAMVASLLLLGKTRFPATFYQYQASRNRVVEETIPLDIMVDVVPELLRMPDSKVQRFVAANQQAVQGFQDIVGQSQAIKYALDLAQRAAIRDVNVLLTGESGTGKELFARAMHNASHRGRCNKPFYALNCAAIPGSLFESELFGAVMGAYTGAVNRSGAFELADGGTLFLDEVGELSADNQAKLLRVLQPRSNDRPCNRWVRRVGAKEEVKIDVRVIAATNRDLHAQVTKGTFRDDLFYRLAVVSVRLPSLRERRTDIETLAGHLMKRINDEFHRTEPGYKDKTLSRGAIQILCKYDWPGNIRELDGVLTQLSVFSDSPEIDASEIKSALRTPALPSPNKLLNRDRFQQIDLKLRLREIEHQFIQTALDETDGSQTKATKLLGVTQQCLSHKLKASTSA